MRNPFILVGLFCASLFALPASAQAAVPGPGYKDPGTATLFSVVVPGGGQMYSGETKRGAIIMGAGFGSLILGSFLLVNEADDCLDDINAGNYNCSTGGIEATAMLGYLGYLAAWGFGIYDAGDSAKRMNARQGLSVAGMALEPIAAPSADGTRFGLTVRF